MCFGALIFYFIFSSFYFCLSPRCLFPSVDFTWFEIVRTLIVIEEHSAKYLLATFFSRVIIMLSHLLALQLYKFIRKRKNKKKICWTSLTCLIIVKFQNNKHYWAVLISVFRTLNVMTNSCWARHVRIVHFCYYCCGCCWESSWSWTTKGSTIETGAGVNVFSLALSFVISNFWCGLEKTAAVAKFDLSIEWLSRSMPTSFNAQLLQLEQMMKRESFFSNNFSIQKAITINQSITWKLNNQ